MAENGGISQKDIDRTYIYFNKQTPEEKRNILDKYFQQRTRSLSGLEREGLICLSKEVTTNIGTLEELCDTHSYKLYEGEKDTKVEMVKDIYRALNEKFGEARREGNTRSYANLAGSRGTGGSGGSGGSAAEGGAAGGTQGGKRRNRNKTKKRKNKNKKKSRRN